MPAGGPRKGSGRKSAAEEQETRKVAIAAIEAKYKSVQKGLEELLASEEPALVKFVFEHACGKPTEKHQVEANINGTQTFEIGGQVFEF